MSKSNCSLDCKHILLLHVQFVTFQTWIYENMSFLIVDNDAYINITNSYGKLANSQSHHMNLDPLYL